ncbi:MAG: hypothetical protein II266_06805 [Clostridia bacterium]|nr:hypothetical protein [Clostridia bacterium]
MNFQQPFQPTYNRYGANYAPAYQQPTYQQPTFSPTHPVYQQDGTIPARFVSGREEAVASNVLPGMPFIFYDRAHGVVFVKAIDPATGSAEFRTFAEVAQPAQDQAAPTPAYVTVDMFAAYQAEIEKRLESFQPTPKRGKVVNDDV